MQLTRERFIHIIAAGALIAAVGSALPAAHAADVIKIGAPLALTGSLADEGKKQDVVWNMWLDKVNAAGGINVGGKKMKVELVKYDYQSDGQRAAQLAEKLITDDKVDFLLSPFGSGHTKIVATVAERYQTPLLACASSSESVFDQSFKHLFGTLSPNGGMTDAMVAFFKSKMPALKRVAVLGRDDVFPKSMAQGTSAAAKKAGLEVVYDQLYAVGTMDHSAALSAIKAANPDWIYVTGYTQDLILARKQMADLGVKAPIVTMVAGPDPVVDAAGPGLHAIWERLAPHLSGAYANFLTSATEEEVAAIYPRETYQRLVAVKDRYDPGNLFAGNHNVVPGPTDGTRLTA